MPAGISDPVWGYAAFGCVKFVGYSLAAKAISRAYDREDWNPLAIGGARTLLGMVAGAAYWAAAAWTLSAFPGIGLTLFLAGLLPVRIAEWRLLLWCFYDRPWERRSLGRKTILWGTVWSYVLDLPAAVGFFVTGGAWIC